MMKRFDVEEGLIATGQPSNGELKALADEGVKTVINIRRPGEAGHPDDWADQVAALGMKYVAIPVGGPDITEESARALTEAMDAAEGKLLVHCGSSNRVGALFALKAKLIDGKSTEEALDYGKKAGLAELESRVRSILDS